MCPPPSKLAKYSCMGKPSKFANETFSLSPEGANCINFLPLPAPISKGKGNLEVDSQYKHLLFKEKSAADQKSYSEVLKKK